MLIDIPFNFHFEMDNQLSLCLLQILYTGTCSFDQQLYRVNTLKLKSDEKITKGYGLKQYVYSHTGVFSAENCCLYNMIDDIQNEIK